MFNSTFLQTKNNNMNNSTKTTTTSCVLSSHSFFKSLSLALVMLVVGIGSVLGQVNAYTFAQTTGTYADITGGTVLITASSNAFGNAGFPDEQIYNISIPYTFTFNGVGYTSLNISSNGFITFGATATTATNYNPISSTEAYAGAISAWGRDLSGMFSVGGKTSTLRWETVGTAPNREVVIQFKDWRIAYSSSTITAPYFNFQIRLKETSNAIDVIYGPSGMAIGTSTSTTSSFAQVGLRGANNTLFLNRTNTTLVSLNSSSAGTLNTSSQTTTLGSFSANTTPGRHANGKIYTWTPPAACTGTPAPGNTLSSASPVCSGASFTLSLQNSTSGSGVTYQWQHSTDGGSTWADVAGATSATLVTSQTVAKSYKCNVTCSGATGTSTAISLGLSGFINCYCAASATSNADEEISNVTFGTLNNSSTCTTLAPGPNSVVSMYSNYASGAGAPAAPNVGQGDPVNYAVTMTTCGGSYGNSTAMYIDYNQNGSFAEANEKVYHSA